MQHSLLAFCFLPAEGVPPNRRFGLVGCAAGAMLHFWRECVPGGDTLRIDGIEIDQAVLDAARTHFGLELLEPASEKAAAAAAGAPPASNVPATTAAADDDDDDELPAGPPGVTFHAADGADYLRDAEDEAYTLLMIDLDMGNLVAPPTQAPAAEASSRAVGANAMTDSGAGTAATRRTNKVRKPPPPDPTRDMYRVLREDGVLVINEYSEEGPAKRLEDTLRLVRLLRRFFPEVHVLRTNTSRNTMLIAPVTASNPRPGAAVPTPDISGLAERASRCCAHLGRGGIDLEALVRSVPPNRYQVYS